MPFRVVQLLSAVIKQISEDLIKEAAKNDEEYLKIKEQLETDDKGSYSTYSISSEDF